MRFVFILLFITPSFSYGLDNYISKSDLSSFKSDQSSPVDYYLSINKCEASEGGACLKISSDQIRQIDDLRKKKVGTLNPELERTVDCDDAQDCQDIIDSGEFSCDLRSTATYDDKANWPDLDFTILEPPRSETGWFMWCQREALVADPDGAAQVDAEDQAKQNERNARRQKEQQRDIKLKQCVRVALKGVSDLPPGSATTQQLAQRQNAIVGCFQALLKEVVSKRLDVDDL